LSGTPMEKISLFYRRAVDGIDTRSWVDVPGLFEKVT
jgi:hypothetical protein